MKTSVTHLSVACFAIGLSLTACQKQVGKDATTTLFKRIPSSHSGLTFNNPIPENDTLNYFAFMHLYIGAGVAAGDVNNDGLTDLFFVSNLGENKLYLNKGGLKFEDITTQAGVLETGGFKTGVTMADVNGDGWLDIYVCKSGWFSDLDRRRNSLFINNGTANGNTTPSFTEAATAWGVDDPSTSIQGAFFDYDKDGDLDMYLVNTIINFDMTQNLMPLDQVHASQELRNLMGYDKLYRNEGTRFIDVSSEAGILSDAGFGFGVVTADFTKDGFIDIFVGNDFLSPDYFYVNNGNGTFIEARNYFFRHTSFYSMGADAADINNDGWLDLFVLDMFPEDYKRSKTTMSMVEPQGFYLSQQYGYNAQYMHNMLHLNNGNNSFSEIGQFSGVSKTDWSWAALLADFDNDGFKDIFITNGIKRDVTERDHKEKVKALALSQNRRLTFSEIIDLIPSRKIPNFLFRNSGHYKFENLSAQWGIDIPSFSNGAVHADLDNDGDLDLVTNNVDDEAFLFENQSNRTANHFLRVRLNGTDRVNPLNATVTLKNEQGELWQFDEFTFTRGYMSRCEDYVHFGLGDKTNVPILEVKWADGKISTLNQVNADQVIEVNYNEAKPTQPPLETPTLFADHSQKLLSPIFRHIENDFNDYRKQVLLPHKFSQNGPCVTVADVNKDGLEDFYIGGAHQQTGELYIQNINGKFTAKKVDAFLADRTYEDTEALFFDADNDGDPDLYVVSGGFEFEENSPNYQDRLYLNTNGDFKKANMLPLTASPGSCILAGDVDGDGDLDLFRGGRVVPEKYPLPARSYVFRNEGGKFVDATEKLAPQVAQIGMVTSAVWTDLNQDNNLDLIVVGEWMGIECFENQNGKLAYNTSKYGFDNTKGWWNHIEEADWDGDGDKDYVVGNLGLNYKFKASVDKPFQLFANDFDNNGVCDVILASKIEGRYKPVRGRTCSSQQMPFIVEKFPTFASFADADVEQIVGKQNLNAAVNYQAQIFTNVLLKNNGGGKFEVIELPVEAQFAPVNDVIVHDFDEDGNPDIFLAGNNYSVEVETTRADAGCSLLLLGKGDGQFTPQRTMRSGSFLPGDVKDLALVHLVDGSKAVLAANNSAYMQIIVAAPTKKVQ
jgi:hypothetical protein